MTRFSRNGRLSVADSYFLWHLVGPGSTGAGTWAISSQSSWLTPQVLGRVSNSSARLDHASDTTHPTGWPSFTASPRHWWTLAGLHLGRSRAQSCHLRHQTSIPSHGCPPYPAHYYFLHGHWRVSDLSASIASLTTYWLPLGWGSCWLWRHYLSGLSLAMHS